MKHFRFKTILSILLVATQISCAQRKAKYYNISGTVTTTSSYCGGAAPSQEMLAEINKPKPVAGKQLFIFTGNQISDSSLLLSSFTTDSLGHFQIKLKKGTYCIVEVQKSKPLKIPKDDENSKWDVDCLKEQHSQCDYQLNVIDKNVDDVKINFHQPCGWSRPCLQYEGPLPPSAPRGK